MEEKILTILLDMQVDMKDLKMRVINIEENEIPSMKESISDLTITVNNIKKKEIPKMRKSIKNLTISVKNIENNELPAIRQQRLIDSNNIAKILSLQTELNQRLSIQRRSQIMNY